ncbi:TPA: cob(I)yrinic acid a,c-diamide adenosyltransferase [Patescibacteria group bacterium]|nr:MAG: hypothetical protein UU98_C0042G0002 [Parcubacteria group bacterium GW2011_GWD2_42_14]HCC05156.1 cob(I)yrinic acid a,c-diamide adenosyltransferase [Patescibacteria group bacterium]
MLYTRKGDNGTTQFFGDKERFSKASILPEALGTLDELNAYLGYCRARISESEIMLLVGKRNRRLSEIFYEVQECLFIIQAEIAGAEKSIKKSKVTELEKITDTIERIVPPIHTFSIPGGTVLSAELDIARTLARRVERRIVGVHDTVAGRKVGVHTLAYCNRLSSLLFALVRYIHYVEHVTEKSPSYS